MIIDNLIEKIIEKNNPSVVGLDTHLEYLPTEMRSGLARELPIRSAPPFRGWETIIEKDKLAERIFSFNQQIIDAIYEIVPAVKIQIAYYEMYGVEGLHAFLQTVQYAKNKGLIVIIDAKRNDIGSTAACYANAYIGETAVEEFNYNAFDGDFVTVNAYLGSDGVLPFLKCIEAHQKGIFILVKTSNYSSGEIQDLKLENGSTVYEHMGQLVKQWGENYIGKFGYSSVGAVVGATYPKQAEILRRQMPSTFFLIPGYGAQGATAEDLKGCFDQKGLGAIVNSSRGILCAYRDEKYLGKPFDVAAREACLAMKNDLVKALHL